MTRLLALVALCLMPLLANAHLFLVKPDAGGGERVGVSVLMTEKLFEGDRLLQPEDVSLRLLGADGERWLALREDAAARVLRADLERPAGTALLSARAAPRYRAIEKGRQTNDPQQTLRIEAFSKALLALRANDPGFALRSGDRLELLPLDNPAHLPAGTALRVQVLFDGLPLVTRVQALHPEQPRQRVETDAQGIAHLHLPHSGAWVLRASHHLDEADSRSAAYEASASLVLMID